MIPNKGKIVDQIFDQIPEYYDIMNDAMSLGIHRIWKHQFVEMCDIQYSDCVLDLACGTGDISIKIAPQLHSTKNQLFLADPSQPMLDKAKNRLLNTGYVANYTQTKAEDLPFNDNTFEKITISFGLRNFTNIQDALYQLYRVLKPKGMLMILEFSKPEHPAFNQVYKGYRDHVIPAIGKHIARDEESYIYLAQSIEEHPNPEEIVKMMKMAQFENTTWKTLLCGVAVIHCAYKK